MSQSFEKSLRGFANLPYRCYDLPSFTVPICLFEGNVLSFGLF